MYSAVGLPTKPELSAYREVLDVWHSRKHFNGYVRMLGERIPTEKLWGNPYKFVREAMTLNAYADLEGKVTALRLGGDPPDGWLRLSSGEEVPVEVTEVLEAGRKRGDEYRGERAFEIEHVTEQQDEARIQTIEPQLDQAISNKTEKYAPNPALLLYLNIGESGRAQERVEAAIARQKAKHAAFFNGIYVIWKGKLY
jgi:hypothetical protein